AALDGPDIVIWTAFPTTPSFTSAGRTATLRIDKDSRLTRVQAASASDPRVAADLIVEPKPLPCLEELPAIFPPKEPKSIGGNFQTPIAPDANRVAAFVDAINSPASATGPSINVVKWDGTHWRDLGPSLPVQISQTGARRFALAIDPSGRLVLASLATSPT